jgi:hypothetical protein
VLSKPFALNAMKALNTFKALRALKALKAVTPLSLVRFDNKNRVKYYYPYEDFSGYRK